MSGLDLMYPSLRAFVRDCKICGEDARALLESGEYVRLSSGWIVQRLWHN